MNLSENETSKLKNLTESYLQAKALILYAEEIDPRSELNLQIIKELRDAFDHLMHTIYEKYNPDSDSDSATTPEENIDKALEHIYRATYDALDGAVLSLKELIIESLSNYPVEVIKEVLGDYWDIKKEVNRISGRVAEYRGEKTHENNDSGVLDSYVEDLDKLKNIYDKILENGNLLDECVRQKKKRSWKKTLLTFTIGL